MRIAASTLFGITLACRGAPSPPAGDAPPRMTIAEVLAAHTDRLMALPGVVGIGEGAVDGLPAVHVLVTELTDDLRRRLPEELEGYRVQVVETGVIRPQQDTNPPRH